MECNQVHLLTYLRYILRYFPAVLSTFDIRYFKTFMNYETVYHNQAATSSTEVMEPT